MELKEHCRERFEPAVQAIRNLLEEKKTSDKPILVAIDGRCGSGKTTWYGFAKKVFELLNFEVNLSPCDTSEFPRPAKRPAYSVMDNNNICRNWEAALSDYIALRVEE